MSLKDFSDCLFFRKSDESTTDDVCFIRGTAAFNLGVYEFLKYGSEGDGEGRHRSTII